MRLDIQISTDKICNIIATDNTIYEASDANYTFVEFVCYVPYSETDDTLTALSTSKKVTFITGNDPSTLDIIYKYTMKKDGNHRYYKYGLYNITHPLIFDGTTYNILNKVFYYNGTIYYGLANTTTPSFDSTNTRVISNWYSLREYVGDSIDYYFDDDLFTICNITHCLIEWQKKAMYDCQISTGNCASDKNSKAIRDFLLASVFVLEHLMSVGNYLEAQRLIEKLSTCGSICGDNNFSTNYNCNCK